MEEVQTIQLDLVKSTKRSLVYSNSALGISNLKVPKPLVESDAPVRIGVTFEVASDAMTAESSIDDLRSKLGTRLQKDKELRGRIRKLEKTCQHDWALKEGNSTERRCLLCGKKDKVREPIASLVQCEICYESKHLAPDVKVNGWWAVAQKKGGGFSSRPLKVTGLKPTERAACGIGHLMILCERAASGSLDKTVYPDNNKKPVGLTETAVLNGEGKPPSVQSFEDLPPENLIVTGVDIVDDIPPDPNVTPEPEVPVLAEPVTKFHVLPLLVRLVNKHVRPPLDEFPFPSGASKGVWET
jgi:hypothetical protein